MIRTNPRPYCAFCAIYSRPKRTHYICGHPECQLPLCSVVTGKVEEDCFALSRLTQETPSMTLKKYHVMLLRTNNDKNIFLTNFLNFRYTNTLKFYNSSFGLVLARIFL